MQNGDRTKDRAGVFSPWFPREGDETPSSDKFLEALFAGYSFAPGEGGIFLGRETPDGPVTRLVKILKPRKDRP